GCLVLEQSGKLPVRDFLGKLAAHRAFLRLVRGVDAFRFSLECSDALLNRTTRAWRSRRLLAVAGIKADEKQQDQCWKQLAPQPFPTREVCEPACHVHTPSDCGRSPLWRNRPFGNNSDEILTHFRANSAPCE